MKLYYAPNACSIGIHVLMEELGLEFDAEAIDLRSRQQNSESYLAVNPKGKIPALVRDDGSLLTEFSAIAYWLAETHPEAGLFGGSIEDRARTLELLDYIVGSVHMRGFVFIISPQKFVSDDAAIADLRTHGTAVVTAGLTTLSELLGDQDFLQGTFGLADPALFYLLHWAKAFGVETPDNLSAFYGRMMQRPAVQRAIAREAAGAA